MGQCAGMSPERATLRMEPLRVERETVGVASFEDVFVAEFRPLYRYLRRRVGAAVVEDLAEAAFATAFANWERSIPPARPVRGYTGSRRIISAATGGTSAACCAPMRVAVLIPYWEKRTRQ